MSLHKCFIKLSLLNLKLNDFMLYFCSSKVQIFYDYYQSFVDINWEKMKER